MTNTNTHEAAPRQTAGTALLFFIYFMHGISGLLLGTWLNYMFAPLGNPSAGTIFKLVLLTTGVVAAQITLSTLALRLVPSLKRAPKRYVTFVISAFLLLIGIFSGLACASMIGRATGEKAYFQQNIEQMHTEVARDKDLVSKINVLIPTLHNCTDMVKTILANELLRGAISQQGGKTGPVSTELATITLACANAEKALQSSHSASSGILDDMDRATVKARRIADNDTLTPEAKMLDLVRVSEQLAAFHKELGQAVPIKSLQPVSETLSKDLAAMGLAPEAVAFIKEELRPISKAIGQDLDETFELLQAPFETMRPITNPMLYLAILPGEMLVAIVIATLLEVTPLIIISVFLLASIQSQESDDDGDNTGQMPVQDRPDTRSGRVAYMEGARTTPS